MLNKYINAQNQKFIFIVKQAHSEVWGSTHSIGGGNILIVTNFFCQLPVGKNIGKTLVKLGDAFIDNV